MIPVDQEILQGLAPGCKPLPGQRPGDCLRACVASLLELNLHDVPHFIEEHDVRWFEGIQEFLAKETSGIWTICCTEVAWPSVVGTPDPENVPPLQRYVIASGPSPRGPWLHSVLVDAFTGELAHDPHPSRQGVTGHLVDLLILVPA